MILSLAYNIFLYYCALSVATGITSYFTVYKEIIAKILDSDANEETKELCNSMLYKFILITTSSVIAPFMIKHTICGPSEDFVETFVNKARKRGDK